MKKPVVAIIGRPNVGKSTLFNRLISRRLAIVDDKPGVTRDRLATDVTWQDHHFVLIDTGGLVPETEDRMEQIIKAQVEIAIEEADILLFLVDGKTGLVPQDREIAQLLQKVEKPVMVVMNKADNDKLALSVSEFFELGLGDPVTVSAMQGISTGDLLDRIAGFFPTLKAQETQDAALKVAIVGKPNVGKSSLLNAIIREDRVLVDNVPGTTRDSVDTRFKFQGEDCLITDTAGIRRKRKIREGVEYYSTLRALNAVYRSDVALVLIDAEEGLTKQDMRIIEEVVNAGKGIIVLVNKWDLISKDNSTYNACQKAVMDKLGRLYYIPVEFISALKRQRVMRPIEMAREIQVNRNRKIKTAELNQFLKETCALRSYFTPTGREIKINYVTQISTQPPGFSFFCNYPNDIKLTQRRFLERNLRKRFDFNGTPVKLYWREKHQGRS